MKSLSVFIGNREITDQDRIHHSNYVMKDTESPDGKGQKMEKSAFYT